jgi:hypothetical protein
MESMNISKLNIFAWADFNYRETLQLFLWPKVF